VADDAHSRPGAFTKTYLHRGDDRLLSPCCRAPQDVAFGEIRIDPDNPANWSQSIDHLCGKCGLKFEPEDGLAGPGELWRKRKAERGQ